MQRCQHVRTLPSFKEDDTCVLVVCSAILFVLASVSSRPSLMRRRLLHLLEDYCTIARVASDALPWRSSFAAAFIHFPEVRMEQQFTDIIRHLLCLTSFAID